MKIVIRCLIVVLLPISMLFAVIYRIWRETRRIPFYVWCDLREEVTAARRAWRDPSSMVRRK